MLVDSRCPGEPQGFCRHHGAQRGREQLANLLEPSALGHVDHREACGCRRIEHQFSFFGIDLAFRLEGTFAALVASFSGAGKRTV